MCVSLCDFSYYVFTYNTMLLLWSTGSLFWGVDAISNAFYIIRYIRWDKFFYFASNLQGCFSFLRNICPHLIHFFAHHRDCYYNRMFLFLLYSHQDHGFSVCVYVTLAGPLHIITTLDDVWSWLCTFGNNMVLFWACAYCFPPALFVIPWYS